MVKNVSLILACDSKNGLGKNGGLAWKISKDLKYFKKTTILTKNPEFVNVVLMGRKTWESIPKKFRPLPGRINVVLTKNPDFNDEGCIVFTSINEFLTQVNKIKNIEKLFIIGGANIYNQFLNNENLEKIYLTKVEGDFSCDVFFDGIPDNFILEGQSEELEENGVKFRFLVYNKN